MKKATKFIITGQGRCGSNLLKYSLKEHPEVCMVGEYYNANIYKDIDEQEGNLRARTFFGSAQPRHKAIGFKIFAHHATHKPRKSVWRYLTTKKVSVIHLIRKNSLERLISLYVAQVSKAWLANDDKQELHDSVKLNHPPEFWLEKIKKDQAIEAGLTERFSDNNYMHLTYEDLVENWDAEIARIETFLQIDQVALLTTLKKQEKRSKAERLENYDELVAFFRDTEFAWMFD